MRRAFYLIALLAASTAPGFAQATVGNGTVILPSFGQKESYGLNDQAPNQNNGSAFPTRHYGRANNNAGIGGSTIGTESVTSESSPASAPVSQTRTQAIEFRLPKLETGSIINFGSPALGTFTPALPSVPRSSALTSPSQSMSGMYRFNSTQSDVQNMPSFSKKESVTDMLQFDKFSNFK
jgi:hypothetical protein